MRMEVDGLLNEREESRIEKILESVGAGLRFWYKIVNTFGLEPDDKTKWEEDLQAEYESCISDCNAAAVEKQHELNEKIASLLEESEKMCKKLSIKMPRFAPSNRGMYNDEKYLIEKVKGWQEEVNKRSVEIEELKARRDEISKTLGVKPFYIKETPLPSKEELDLYLIQIQQLDIEKERRIEKFRALQEKISALSGEIQYAPRLDFERNVISGDALSCVEVSDENMQHIDQFHMDLVERRDNIEQELNKCRETLETLWKVLEEDVKYCNDFIYNHVGINYKTLEAFQAEVSRCEDIRKTNLGKFIEKLRAELIQLWDSAGYSSAKRDVFAIYMDDSTFTEDLLTLHDIEIERVKAHLKENHKIYELLQQRDTTYKRLRDLEERANAPDRFKNRGGQLLKEEKERKAVTKKIPVIEDQLLNLAVLYEEEHGSKFMFWEDTIEDLITRERENIEQERKLQMSARKLKRDVTMSASKMTPRSLYKSPSTVQLQMKSNFLTPRILRTPMRTPKTAPVKKVLTGRRSITKAKARLSTDKKKRAAALRAKMNANKELNENDIDYSKFENELSRKEGAVRSTIGVHSPHAVPTIRVDTPRTVTRQLKILTQTKLQF